VHEFTRKEERNDDWKNTENADVFQNIEK